MTADNRQLSLVTDMLPYTLRNSPDSLANIRLSNHEHSNTNTHIEKNMDYRWISLNSGKIIYICKFAHVYRDTSLFIWTSSFAKGLIPIKGFIPLQKDYLLFKWINSFISRLIPLYLDKFLYIWINSFISG